MKLSYYSGDLLLLIVAGPVLAEQCHGASIRHYHSQYYVSIIAVIALQASRL